MGILPYQLKFAKDTFSVKAGQKVKFTLDNNCTLMQMHNWVLCKQGTKDKVIAESNKFMTDPNAMAKGYIPPSGDILHHTKLVQPKQKDTIEFTAPKEKGDYPYICTFPGHALLMFGTMKVE
ncbi:MAG: plastocyanin/azurin family copper-binding protein [Verrucomicrobiales bacterium]